MCSSLWNVFQDWQVNLTRETLMSSGKKWYSSSVWASLRMYRDNKVLGIYNTLWQKCFLGHKNRAATGVIFYPLRQGERDSHKVTYLLELTRSYFTRQEVVLESNHCSSLLSAALEPPETHNGWEYSWHWPTVDKICDPIFPLKRFSFLEQRSAISI